MRFLLFLLSLMLIVNSCKKERASNKLCFTRSGTELKIENKTDREFYFTAFGQQILPFIDWGPVCKDNNVPPNSIEIKELSSIPGYSGNDSLVVYWWECRYNSPQEIKTVVLSKNQSSCP